LSVVGQAGTAPVAAHERFVLNQFWCAHRRAEAGTRLALPSNEEARMGLARGIGRIGIVAVSMAITGTAMGAETAPATSASVECGPQGHLPFNVVARGVLHSVVGEMLERSATFRQQCEALADAPRLRVHVLIDGVMSHNVRLGETNIRRHEGGVMFAIVEIAAAVDYPVILAHEFEHLIEQLEGHNLPALSEKSRSGVIRTSTGAFETDRAIAAGLTVRREMAASRRASRSRRGNSGGSVGMAPDGPVAGVRPAGM
jgi:hypothetical protein